MKASQYLVFRYYLEGNTDSLAMATAKAKAIARKYNNSYAYYNCWGLLLSNYNLSGMTEKAISEAQEMGKEALSENSSFGIATSYTTSGDAYLYLGLYQEAIHYSLRAIKEMEKSPEDQHHNISNSCYSIILSYSGLKQYDQIIPYCEKIDSIATAEEAVDKDNMANVSYRLVAQCGRVIAYSHLKQIGNARHCYQKALKYYEICQTQLDYMLEAEATFFEASGRYKAALKSYEKLSDYYSSMGIVKERLRITRAEADLLVKENNYKAACKYYSDYILGVDSLNNSNSLRQLNEFAILYDLQRAENESSIAERQIQKTRQNMVTIISACLLASLLVSLFFILKQHRTNRKLRASEVNQKKALIKAEESDRLKSAFLANMSHEIRTPLNSIVGFSELIAETDDKDEKEQYRNIIKTNSEQLLTLINDVLDLSKIESGIVDLKREDFNIVPFINNLFSSFNTLKRSPDVKLVLDNPYEDDHIVCLDKHRLTQLYTNFVTNALKFTQSGEVKMGYKIESHSLYIYVSDTGKGISEEQKSKVFDRFFKLDDFSQGNGLGLAISKAIINAGGGQIGVSSEVGKGSTFWAWIPYKSSGESSGINS